jgi:predicted acylesterase/phospholipase RssA
MFDGGAGRSGLGRRQTGRIGKLDELENWTNWKTGRIGKLGELENWARGLTQARFLRYLDLKVDRGGLVEGAAVTRVLSQIGLPDRIEDLEKPLLVVATDMTTGREVWLWDGPLSPAVRASIAIPGVFAATGLRMRPMRVSPS